MIVAAIATIATEAAVVFAVANGHPVIAAVVAGIFSLLNTIALVVLPPLLRRRGQRSRQVGSSDPAR